MQCEIIIYIQGQRYLPIFSCLLVFGVGVWGEEQERNVDVDGEYQRKKISVIEFHLAVDG